MKVVVTGGRNYDDRETLYRELDKLAASYVVQGSASGADYLAKQYAAERKLPCVTVRADWQIHGRAAGPIRNCLMLKAHVDATVVAFPGNAGTANCVRQARALGMRVHVVTS